MEGVSTTAPMRRRALPAALDKMGLEYSIRSDTEADVYDAPSVTELTLALHNAGRIPTMPWGSRQLAGSSRMRKSGSPARATAMPRRWRIPREKCLAFFFPHYKNGKALNGLTMHVEKGAIYGFVGRNIVPKPGFHAEAVQHIAEQITLTA